MIKQRLLIVIMLMIALPACSLSGGDDDPTPAPEESATKLVVPTNALPTDSPTRTTVPTIAATATAGGGQVSVTILPQLNPTNTNAPGGGGVSVTIQAPVQTLPPPGGGSVSVTIQAQATATAVPLASPTEASPWPETFRDRYEVTTGAGRTIIVDYNVVLNQPGEVIIFVRDPNGEVIGGEIITETANTTLEVTTDVSGIHEILVAFERLPGSYAVSFSTR